MFKCVWLRSSTTIAHEVTMQKPSWYELLKFMMKALEEYGKNIYSDEEILSDFWNNYSTDGYFRWIKSEAEDMSNAAIAIFEWCASYDRREKRLDEEDVSIPTPEKADKKLLNALVGALYNPFAYLDRVSVLLAENGFQETVRFSLLKRKQEKSIRARIEKNMSEELEIAFAHEFLCKVDELETSLKTINDISFNRIAMKLISNIDDRKIKRDQERIDREQNDTKEENGDVS